MTGNRENKREKFVVSLRELFCMALSLFDFNEPVAAKLGLEHRLIAACPTQNICPPRQELCAKSLRLA
jgi:hypothetical protein